MVSEGSVHRDTKRSTMLLGLLFTGNLATAISIGGFEIITKLILYFFHERFWARVSWGIISRTPDPSDATKTEN